MLINAKACKMGPLQKDLNLNCGNIIGFKFHFAKVPQGTIYLVLFSIC